MLGIRALLAASGANVSYFSEVMRDSPLAYWRLGEASGLTATDISGNSHDGTYSGVGLGKTGLLTGDSDTALESVGSDYTNIPNHTDFDNTSSTYEIWVKFNSIPTGTAAAFLSRHSTSGSFNGFTLFVNSEGSINCSIKNGSTNIGDPKAAIGATAGVIYHVVVVLAPNGGTARVYINGVERGTDTVSGAWSFGAHPIRIGRSQDTFWSSPSVIADEVAVYGQELSASRILAHYHAGI